MLDDFFIRALIAGIGVAIVTGPLGCFVIWRRLSYFGDTLSHSALLGVTLAYSMEFNIAFSVFIISSLIALTLIQLQKRTNLPGDALLGLLAHSSLAVGLDEIFLAIAAGIINIPVINNKPTILIDMAMIAAIKIVNIALALSGFKPSASASS